MNRKINYKQLCMQLMEFYNLTETQTDKLEDYLVQNQLKPKEIRIHDSKGNANFGYAKKRQAPNKRWVLIGLSNQYNQITKTIWAEIII